MTRALFAWAVAGVAGAATACSRAGAPEGEAADAAEAAAPAPAASASAVSSEVATSSAAPLDAATSSAAPLDAATSSAAPLDAATRTADAGPRYCRTVRGPIELPLRGPAALVAHADRVDAVLDDDGRPRLASFAAPPLAAGGAPARESVEGGAQKGLRVPCAVAGDVAFCPNHEGEVHRARLDGSADHVVASTRTGTRITAAPLGGSHAAMAYLASRKTTEGWVSEAWLAVDDDAPVRLSEDGSGATAALLVPRGPSMVALTVDARVALTALHARPVAFDHGARLGEDAVVFVGGPGDRRTGLAAAVPPSGPGWALLPIARDITTFGLAVIRLEDPPKVDEAVEWSMYPNGLDPAPVAAALRAGRAWVARVRPETGAASAAKVLELGELTAAGTFVPREIVPTEGATTDVSLAPGPQGDLWLAWLDNGGSWLERLACP